ncbi:hypothetical protein GC105_12430 [Alkalibaculum sp. M08DMB]|uniref:Cell division topological specificity factor n=1 Tax=Alkalibaculum sporogenes TaxID=2655001 RepID=A0A6A7KB67_9FIRM|nr:cell division topological specificity factor MinE [Alkalibaculum sporogenes]MPW26595.1 hypothetical protein [Alkalibaculum sporogenes]
MVFFKSKQNSKDVAKQRLKNIIANEKNNMTTEKLDIIKSEILHSVEDYFTVDRQSSEVYIAEENKEAAIVIILPIAKDNV